jgi:SAM-dependent methyltransferase
MDFSHFDVRGYPTVSVQKGYGEWVKTYESSVEDEMDVRLLEGFSTVAWSQMGTVLDLACGTGRIGAWLRGKNVGMIDGVDFTAEMLAVAAEKGIYRQLVLGDICRVPLAGEQYDLCIESLACEHLADVGPLYREAARLLNDGGKFVIVGYHPHFLMRGLITHFHRAQDDAAVGIESYVHLLSDHVKAGLGAGLTLMEMDERIVDEAWLAKKPQWEKYFSHPVSFGMVWGTA